MITAEQIDTVFQTVANCKRVYDDASNFLIKAKYDFESAKLRGLADGTIEGKNAEMREAAAREVLQSQYQRLLDAEQQEREDKFNLDLAYLELDCLKMQMRFAELQAAK